MLNEFIPTKSFVYWSSTDFIVIFSNNKADLTNYMTAISNIVNEF